MQRRVKRLKCDDFGVKRVWVYGVPIKVSSSESNGWWLVHVTCRTRNMIVMSASPFEMNFTAPAEFLEKHISWYAISISRTLQGSNE